MPFKPRILTEPTVTEPTFKDPVAIEPETTESEITTPRTGASDFLKEGYNKQQIQISVTKASKKYNVPESHIYDIIRAEGSKGDPNAISPVGAQGIMQVMPETAMDLGLKDPFNIDESIDAGTRYYKQQLETFGGDRARAHAAYNWGPSRVKKLGDKFHMDRLPEETQGYLKNIGLPSVVPVDSPMGQEIVKEADGALNPDDLIVFGSTAGEEMITALPKGAISGGLRVGQSLGTAMTMIGQQMSPEDLVPMESLTPHVQMQIRGEAGRYVKDGMDPDKALMRARFVNHLESAIELDGASEFMKSKGQIIEKWFGDQAESWTPEMLKGKSVWDHSELWRSPTWWLFNTGNTLVQFGVTLGAGGATMKGTKIVGNLARMSPKSVARVAQLGGAIAGGVTGGMLESTATYRGVRDAGGSPQEALASAQMMFLFATGLNAISMGKIFSKMGNDLKSKTVKRLGNAAWESLTESAENPAEVVAELMGTMLSGGEMPDEIWPLFKQSFKDTLDVAPFAAIGGAVAPVGKSAPRKKKGEKKDSETADDIKKSKFDQIRVVLERKTGVKTKEKVDDTRTEHEKKKEQEKAKEAEVFDINDGKRTAVTREQWDLLKSGDANMSKFYVPKEVTRDINAEIAEKASATQKAIDAQGTGDSTFTPGVISAAEEHIGLYGDDPFATTLLPEKEAADIGDLTNEQLAAMTPEERAKAALGPEATAAEVIQAVEAVKKVQAKTEPSVKDVAKALSKQLGIQITVVDKLTDAMKLDAKARGIDPNRIKGARSKKTGKIWLFSPNLTGKKALETGMHEVIHGEIEQYEDQFDSIYEANKESIDSIKEEAGIKDNNKATREWLALVLTKEVMGAGKIKFKPFIKKAVKKLTNTTLGAKVETEAPAKSAMDIHKEEVLADAGIETDGMSKEYVDGVYDTLGETSPIIDRMNQIRSVRDDILELTDEEAAKDEFEKFNQTDLNKPSLMLMDGTEVFGPPIEGRNFSKWRDEDRIGLDKSYRAAESIAREEHNLDPTDAVRGFNLDGNWFSGEFIAVNGGLFQTVEEQTAANLEQLDPNVNKNLKKIKKDVVEDIQQKGGLAKETEKIFLSHTNKNVVGKVIFKAKNFNKLLQQYTGEELAGVVYEAGLNFVQDKVRNGKQFNSQEYFGMLLRSLSDFAINEEASKQGTTAHDIRQQLAEGTFQTTKQKREGVGETPEELIGRAGIGTQADIDAVEQQGEVTLDPGYQEAIRRLKAGIMKAKKSKKVMAQYKGQGTQTSPDSEVILVASKVMPAKDFNDIMNSIDPDVLPSAVKKITPEERLISMAKQRGAKELPKPAVGGPLFRETPKGRVPKPDFEDRLSERTTPTGTAVVAEPRPELPGPKGTPVQRRQAVKERIFGPVATMGDSRALEEHKERRKHLAGTFTQKLQEDADKFKEKRLERTTIYKKNGKAYNIRERAEDVAEDLNEANKDPNVNYVVQHKLGEGYVIERHRYVKNAPRDIKFGASQSRLNGAPAVGHRGQLLQGEKIGETKDEYINSIIAPPAAELLAGVPLSVLTSKTKGVVGLAALQQAYLARVSAAYKILSDKNIKEQLGATRQIQLAEATMIRPDWIESTWRNPTDKPKIKPRPVMTEVAHLKELRKLSIPEHQMVITTSAAKAAWGIGRNPEMEVIVSTAAHKALDANPEITKKVDVNGNIVWVTKSGNIKFIPAEQARIPIDFTRVKSRASKMGKIYVEEPMMAAARLKEDGLIKESEELMSAMVGKPRPLTVNDVLESMKSSSPTGGYTGTAGGPVVAMEVGGEPISQDHINRLINGTMVEAMSTPIDKLLDDVEEARKSEHRGKLDDIIAKENQLFVDWEKAYKRKKAHLKIDARQEKLIESRRKAKENREAREKKEQQPGRKQRLEALRKGLELFADAKDPAGEARAMADMIDVIPSIRAPKTLTEALTRPDFKEKFAPVKEKLIEERRGTQLNKTAQERLLAMAETQEAARKKQEAKKVDAKGLPEGTAVIRYKDGKESHAPTALEIALRATTKRKFQIKNGKFKLFTVKDGKLKSVSTKKVQKETSFELPGAQTTGINFMKSVSPSVEVKQDKTEYKLPKLDAAKTVNENVEALKEKEPSDLTTVLYEAEEADGTVTTRIIKILPEKSTDEYEAIADLYDTKKIDLTKEQLDLLTKYWGKAQEIEDNFDVEEEEVGGTFTMASILNNEKGGVPGSLLEKESSPVYRAGKAVYKGLKTFVNDKERVGKKVAKYLNVESNFGENEKETGFHTKNIWSFQEAVMDKYKRDVMNKFNDIIVKNMPDADREQLAVLVFVAEDTEYQDFLVEEIGEIEYNEVWKEPVDFLRKVFEDARKLYAERGVLVDFVAQETARVEKRFLQPTIAKGDTREEREFNAKKQWDKALKDMKRLRDLEHIEFMHIPSSLWAGIAIEEVVPGEIGTDIFKKKVSNLRKSLKKRHKLRVADLVRDGLVKTEAVNPYEILAHYGANMAEDFSYYNIRDAALKEGLIRRSKTKPTKNGPWERLPERMSALETKKPNLLRGEEEPLTTWIRSDVKITLDHVLASDVGKDAWSRWMNMYKMMQFYNPIFLPMYDAVQSVALAGAIGVKTSPSAIAKAFKSAMNHDEIWDIAAREGLFSKPFAPQFVKDLQRARKQAQIQGRGYRGTLENYLHFEIEQIVKMYNQGQPGRAAVRSMAMLIKPIMEISWNTAWTLDNAIRLYTFNFLKGQGLSDRDAAQTAALAHGDYAGVPARTRRQLNRLFFTPTFKVAMARAHYELASGILEGVKTKDFKRGSRGRQSLRAALAFIAFNLGVNMLFRSLGYEPDDRDPYRRYSREITIGGKTQQHVINFSHPANLLSKYGAGIWNVIFQDPAADNAWLDFAKRFRYDIIPFAQDMVNLLDNRRPDGSQIYNTSDTFFKQNLDKGAYAILNMVPIINDSISLASGTLSKGRRESQEHLGKLSHFLINTIAFTYVKGNKGEEVQRKLTNMKRNLARELKAEYDETGKIRIDWMTNVYKRQAQVMDEYMKKRK
jgi:hypothetical protein